MRKRIKTYPVNTRIYNDCLQLCNNDGRKALTKYQGIMRKLEVKHLTQEEYERLI